MGWSRTARVSLTWSWSLTWSSTATATATNATKRGARRYAIASDSAMQCAAVLDVARALGSLQESQPRQAIELLARVVAMLTKLRR